MKQQYIRNFCIIAHIDHGKSTLADRLIERARIVDERLFKDQLLDSMDIERERGISIKSHAISIPHGDFNLNLVDTPGHVDFGSEVSRAIASCEGALLLIDATQGVEAQTLSNLYLALEQEITIIPVINKIDLPGARIEEVRSQIAHELGLEADDAVSISAKQDIGIDKVLQAVVERIPPPTGDPHNPLQALIFDSHYDAYRGIVIHLRLIDGHLKVGDRIRMWSSLVEYRVEEVGRFRYLMEPVGELHAGDVGYLIAGIKTMSDVAVGDTLTQVDRPCSAALPGFRPIKPVVFSSLYPINADEYAELQRGIERLQLNDAALSYEKDSSTALGFGFRCGFLGLLHLEITQERLEREFGLSIILTAPSVRYRVVGVDGETIIVNTPQHLPVQQKIVTVYEPYIRGSILCPAEYLGGIMALCIEKRGIQQHLHWLDQRRVSIDYLMPLAEILFDFYDRLKSCSRGYASFDYELDDERPVKLARLDILINGTAVDALSQLIYAEHAQSRARSICRRLREEIPRRQFKIPIQGAIGGQIIARETIPAYRKDVTAKCYGGDITRKRKLLEKQKSGKKRNKLIGSVELPQSAFLSVLRTSE